METLRAKPVNTVLHNQRKTTFFDRGSNLYPTVSLLTPLENVLLQGQAVKLSAADVDQGRKKLQLTWFLIQETRYQIAIQKD